MPFRYSFEHHLTKSQDPAHNDIAVPSPWLWETVVEPRMRRGAKAVEGGVCAAIEQRKPQLLILARCVGPADGYRAPLWRFYGQSGRFEPSALPLAYPQRCPAVFAASAAAARLEGAHATNPACGISWF